MTCSWKYSDLRLTGLVDDIPTGYKSSIEAAKENIMEKFEKLAS